LIAKRIDEITSFIVMDVLEKAHEMEESGTHIIHMEVGEPDFDTPQCIKEAACKALDEGHTHYTSSLGIRRISIISTTPLIVFLVVIYVSIIGPQVFLTDGGTFAYPYPGISTKENSSFMLKKLISWVRPGVELVFTRRFLFTRVFIREDLPTLERPAKAISGKTAGGYWDGLTALVTNSADLIIKILLQPVHSFGDVIH